ncbi:MAG: heparan-alpha-glucosaminide N-acetyltransferase domain-containing protein [Sterolibacterium sp.]
MTHLQNRSRALDVMRGMTLALMIVVNMSLDEAHSYAPLLHAAWHGLTLTDLVFPSFMFVVGAAMSFTLSRYQGMGNAALLKKILSRSALIFLCGYLLYWFPFFEFDKAGQLALLPVANTRIPGVLQRIALGYGCAALIVHYWGRRGAIAFGIVALLGYWWAMASFGDYTLAGNAGLKLDKLLLGESHLYRGEGVAFDPEGILSTLPAVVNVLAGYYAGRYLQAQGRDYEAVAKLMLAGATCIVAALCWDSAFPINKKLWTSSYVLVTIGIDLVVLAALIQVIDLAGPAQRRWTYFFEVFGRNTLFIYLLSELLMSVSWLAHVGDKALFTWLYESGFQSWAGNKPGSLLFALAFMLSCWLIGYAMDRKKIYIKL